MRLYEHPKDGDLKEIKIELTKKCPLSCIHCSSDASSENTLQLTLDSVLTLINQAAALHVQSIAFSGGEPLLWPWLKETIKACKSLGLHCSLYSTGINSTNDGTEEIIELSRYGLNKVIFSLYSPDKILHESITRISGSFEKTLFAIQGLKNININKEIHFVPFKMNYHQLNELVELSKTSGISQISILRFVPQGRGVLLKQSHEMLMHSETIELMKMVRKIQNKNGVVVRIGSPYNILLLNRNIDCITAQKTLSVGPNGNIYPCDAFKNIEPNEIGLHDSYNNVLKRSLKECWEKSAYLNAIRHYLTTPFEEPCINCVYLEQCKSGCLAQKVIEQESIENGYIAKRADPLCLRSLIGG
jgi:radical SAM protein with 4Fe4S-binding SPASM domain